MIERGAEMSGRDRAQAALADGSMGGDGERNEVDDMSADRFACFSTRAHLTVFKRLDVTSQQLQSVRLPRQVLHQPAVEAYAASRDFRAWKQNSDKAKVPT